MSIVPSEHFQKDEAFDLLGKIVRHRETNTLGRVSLVERTEAAIPRYFVYVDLLDCAMLRRSLNKAVFVDEFCVESD